MHATINGAPIHYVDEGNPNGMPVVFLHGFPFSHEMWREQLALTGRTHRAIAYDIRGHGRSYIGEAQFTIEHHVDDLIALLDFLQLSRVVIVGLSMGGYITLRALERHPERFRAAVLCDTKSEADTDEGKLKRFETMTAVRKHGSEVFAEGFIKNVFAPSSFAQNPEGVNLIKTIIKHTPVLSIAGTLLALASRTDTTASLSRITVPVLILVGELDVTTPPAHSEAMHKRIPGSEFHIIPNAAHMSNLENLEEFNRHLTTFLNKIAAL